MPLLSGLSDVVSAIAAAIKDLRVRMPAARQCVVTVPWTLVPVQEFRTTIIDAAVTPASIITAALGPTIDTDENDAEMLDLVSITAFPAAGQFDLLLHFSEPVSGPIQINYFVG